MIREIFKFNREVLDMPPKPFPLDLTREERQWLIGALKEEVIEFEDSETLAEDVDALLDLVYFAIGGLHRLGLTETQAMDCFAAIHNANMTKSKGVKPTRPQDGSVADAVKDGPFVEPVIAIQMILG